MYSAFYFIVALAILVVVHEFGHFWVARRCGVKVLTFSVGFGRTLWQKTGKDGTKYIVAMIPLGGYVKMLDEREGPVDDAELAYSFNRQPLRSRVAIVAAGPIANLVFAIAAYWLIFVMGIPGIKPIIDFIEPTTPAFQAQLVVGDEIQAINNKPTPTWQSVYKELAVVSEHGGTVNLTIASGTIQQQRQITVPKRNLEQKPQQSLLEQLGITPVRIKLLPIVDNVVAGGAADRAGLKKGDLLLSHNGQHIDDWNRWVDLIKSSPEKALNITIERNKQQIDLALTPAKGDDNSGFIGARVNASATPIPKALQAELRHGPIDALYYASKETWQFTTSTLKSLGGMLVGTVSTKNLGGPISIAQYAGSSAEQGAITFISFLAMISISLGILNLLPIPILDGGHLMLYFIEALKGSPLSESMQQSAQKLGIMLLLTLMILAFFNDLTRLFG
ncbi:MAG: RIP metalloprotease RseP [Gammaproteobacteria bacterium]|nr:RIP metalloprotease RseP [Gammaproteobacteria bacterium]